MHLHFGTQVDLGTGLKMYCKSDFSSCYSVRLGQVIIHGGGLHQREMSSVAKNLLIQPINIEVVSVTNCNMNYVK